MRVFKFRAWDNEMIYTVVPLSNTEIIEIHPMTKDARIRLVVDVMQFTGLHDKNGKEIYEGDVLYSEIIKWHYIVEWLFGGHFLRSIEEPEYPKTMMIGIGELEIIGNIYENPELMK